MNYPDFILNITWQELLLYGSSLILLLIGLRLLRKRRTKPVKTKGFFDADAEVLRNYSFDHAKNREGDHRRY